MKKWIFFWTSLVLAMHAMAQDRDIEYFESPYLQQWQEHVEAGQPSAAHSDADQWDAVREVHQAVGKIAEQADTTWMELEAMGPNPHDGVIKDRSIAIYRTLCEAGLFELSEKLAAVEKAYRPLPPDTNMLIGLLVPEVGTTRLLAAAQRLRIHVESASTDRFRECGTAAVESLRTARLLSWQGTVIDRIVALETSTRVLEVLSSSLREQDTWDAAWLATLDARLVEAGTGWAPFEFSIQGDRLIVLDLLRQVHGEDGTFLPERMVELELGSEGQRTREDFANAYRGPMQESIEWYDRMTRAGIRCAAATGPDIRQREIEYWILLGERDWLTDNADGRRLVMEPLLSNSLNVLKKERRYRITLAGARVVLAIERYRLTNSTFPESLGELGDLLPDGLDVDPVTEQPWEYQRTGAGYTLASRALPGHETHEATDADPLAGVRIVP